MEHYRLIVPARYSKQQWGSRYKYLHKCCKMLLFLPYSGLGYHVLLLVLQPSHTAERSTGSKTERTLCSVNLVPYGLARLQPAWGTTQACCLTLKAMVCWVQCTYFSIHKLHTLKGSYIYVKMRLILMPHLEEAACYRDGK